MDVKIMKERKISGLSEKEVTIVAWLEFYQKYYFTIEEINHFFKDKMQRYNTIKSLLRKKRIIKLNKTKYYLVPMKAKGGAWTDEPFIVADEIMNEKDYYIGGWSAANYYRLTDQIPFWIEVYSNKKQGRKKILNIGFIFRRTTKKNIDKATIKNMQGHLFRIMNKKEMKKWMKLRESLV